MCDARHFAASRNRKVHVMAPHRTIAVLVLAIFLSGCALGGTPPPEPVTINFAIEDGQREEYEQFLEPFNKQHPETTVNLQNDRRDDTDCFVDVPFGLPGDVDAGALVALDPFFDQDAELRPDDFYPGAVDVLKYQGKTWGIPAGIDPLVLYYNEEMFDQAGIPYPQPGWTWDDFLTDAMALSNPDERIFGYAMPQQSQDAFDVALFIYQHGGRLFDDLNNPTMTTLDDPQTVSAVEWYTDLALRHNVAPTPEQMRSFGGGSNQGLGRGIYESKFGMWLGFFSDRGGRTWPVTWPWPWGMISLPRDETAATAGLVRSYFILSDRPNPDACWKFISFLSTQAPEGLVPARRSVAESQAFTDLVGEEQAAAARQAVEEAMLISPAAANATPALEYLSRAVREILAGAATPEEALRAAQQQAESAAP